jgi:hypothetical protein
MMIEQLGTERKRAMRMPRWFVGEVLCRTALVLLVSGCMALATGSPAAASARNPSGETTMPFDQSLDKVSQVFLQLLSILQTQGVDAARQYAKDQGLMTTQDEVRATLVLDTDDAAVVDEVSIAIGRLGGRVTATFEDTIEIVVPVQTIADSVTRAAQGAFDQTSIFQALADFQHVQNIHRTPLAFPASR